MFGDHSRQPLNSHFQPILYDQIKEGQCSDLHLEEIRHEIVKKRMKDFQIAEDGALRSNGRLCVPDDGDLRYQILKEAHTAPYAVHPSATKMYHDLKEHYWWEGLKRDVVEFVGKCLTHQQVKAEYQNLVGLLQPLDIPEWKWEYVSMDCEKST